MNQSIGTLLFVVAVVGNAAVIAVGLVFGLFVTVQRSVLAGIERSNLAALHDSAFHHPDKIHTPLGEWIFMAGAITLVLVGLPVALAAIFQFVLPLLGHAWTN